MVQFRFTTLRQISFQSAFTTVRFIIIGIIYKSHWYYILLNLIHQLSYGIQALASVMRAQKKSFTGKAL